MDDDYLHFPEQGKSRRNSVTGLVLPRDQAVVEAGFMPRQPHSQATLWASRLAGLREAESWKKNKYSGRGEEELRKSLRLLISSHKSRSHRIQQEIISPQGLTPKCFQHELFASLITKLFKCSQATGSLWNLISEPTGAWKMVLMILPSGSSPFWPQLRGYVQRWFYQTSSADVTGLAQFQSLFLTLQQKIEHIRSWRPWGL